MAKTALLAAGGTGGHLFPAEALAHELIARGWQVHLATDTRAERFAASFPGGQVHLIPSATLSSRNPVAVVKTLWTLARGYLAARKLLARLKPDIVMGFGGYPTLPPLLAASHRKIPVLLHEQNAVLGRANAALAGQATAIATGFPLAKNEHGDKVAVTGNPVRPAVLEAARKAFVAPADGNILRLLVFGGSQGAQFFSKIVPEALALLPPELMYRIRLTQQARPEDEVALRNRFEEMGVEAQVAPFFTDMPARIAEAHLVMSRAGASTVSELALIGRPCILVPYPHALDHDQAANAAELAKTGGAMISAQKNLTAQKLADVLVEALENPDLLVKRAAAAKMAGKPGAAQRLADMAETVARRG